MSKKRWNKKSLPKSTPVKRCKRSRRKKLIPTRLDRMTISLRYRPGRKIRKLIKTIKIIRKR